MTAPEGSREDDRLLLERRSQASIQVEHVHSRFADKVCHMLQLYGTFLVEQDQVCVLVHDSSQSTC